MQPWRTEQPAASRPIDLSALPVRRDGHALKRWRYVGAFGESAMLCVGLAHVGGLPQAWWAVWDRERRQLHEHTVFLRARATVAYPARGVVRVRDRGVAIDLVVQEIPGVESINPHGGGWIWTRKQAAVRVRGTVLLRGGRSLPIDTLGVVDETAGYHARHTAWRWSAGVGETVDGRVAGWNLVTGVNDGPVGSERSVWLDGVAHEAAPTTFTADLTRVTSPDGGDLRFAAEATRERHDELLLARSDYVQPFGTFTGTLPGGAVLAHGFGVMEDHRARW
jgi:hypothetical protein